MEVTVLHKYIMIKDEFRLHGNRSLSFSNLLTCLQQPVQEPEKMTEIIVQALEITGQRGIINKGWGGLGNSKS